MLSELQNTNKRFQFKQGLDERILTEEKCNYLFNSKYDSDYIFAFDNIEDYDLIENKLKLIRKYTDRQCVFYVLCGFDRNHQYNNEFWTNDIIDVFKRVELLMKYKCLPYIMRFNKYEESPYRGMYINLARWCNQPSFFKKKSFYEFCNMPIHKGRATEKYLKEYLLENPDFDTKYIHMTF